MIIIDQSDMAILKELGRRLMTIRLNKNVTQIDLAKKSGLDRKTVQRLESGDSIQSLSLIKILRSLDSLDQLDNFLPETMISPIQQLKSKAATRQRASRNKTTPPTNKAWVWGDDQ
ncbi:MAG: transcriptional regulator with XRE-family HTH domain [Candidatus Omnitrophota bacterium]|jgi:transcriptional regulator with XRE-family HTH domain